MESYAFAITDLEQLGRWPWIWKFLFLVLWMQKKLFLPVSGLCCWWLNTFAHSC